MKMARLPYGKIRSDGNGTIEQAGFYVRISMDGNDTVLLADNLSDDDSFSITYSSKDSFYFQAFARNEKGETLGAWKRVGATVHSYPIDGAVETGDGWLASEWFGEFRYFENGWAYHYRLGWVYLGSDGAYGIWLWRKEHGWLWSNQSTWPFLTMPVATGPTCSFVKNRTPSFLTGDMGGTIGSICLKIKKTKAHGWDFRCSMMKNGGLFRIY